MRNNISVIFLWTDWETFWQGWIFTHWTGNLGSRKVGNLVTQSCCCDGSNASLMMDKNGLTTCHHWQPKKKKKVILQIKLVYTNFNIHFDEIIPRRPISYAFAKLSHKIPSDDNKNPKKHPASAGVLPWSFICLFPSFNSRSSIGNEGSMLATDPRLDSHKMLRELKLSNFLPCWSNAANSRMGFR